MTVLQSSISHGRQAPQPLARSASSARSLNVLISVRFVFLHCRSSTNYLTTVNVQEMYENLESRQGLLSVGEDGNDQLL